MVLCYTQWIHQLSNCTQFIKKACREFCHSTLKRVTCQTPVPRPPFVLFINVLKRFWTPQHLWTSFSHSASSSRGRETQDVRWEQCRPVSSLHSHTHIQSHTHTHTHTRYHTPTDRFAHCAAAVTVPTAGQMSLHMDKAGERRQLRSH